MRNLFISLVLCLVLQKVAFGLGVGVSAMFKASTDVIVAEVESTNPRTAPEGARDTAELKVIQTLKGSETKGNVVPLYYHLIFRDFNTHELESPKFVKGEKYIVFITKTVNYNPDGAPLYELTDDWLGAMEEHPVLVEEIIALSKKKEK